MHPPLDRPHPDCQEEIDSLKECHKDHPWQKYTGGCNRLKVALDQCLRLEKKRLLNEMNKDLKQRKLREQEVIAEAFGKTQTFAEYLEQDRDYQQELRKKQEREASAKQKI